jgi:hypothetical protein
MYIVFNVNTSFSCQILMKIKFSRQIFLNVKQQISYKSCHVEPNCSIGRTDIQEIMNKPIAAFRKCA